MRRARVLVVDNRDSFVHTLVGYLGELGAGVVVADAESVDPHGLGGYDGVVVSPGPGRPEDAGRSVDVVREAAAAGVPLLGVCLGHQVIGVAFGARVEGAPELVHGRPFDVHHDGAGLYAGLPDPFPATRYHSLAIVAETVPDVLRVTSRTADGTIMGVAHREASVEGIQFHPESVLTEGGYRLLGNWLARVGVPDAPARGDRLRPHRSAPSAGAALSRSRT